MKKNLYIFHFVLIGLLPLCASLTASLFWQAFCAFSVFHEVLYALLAMIQLFFVAYLGVLFRTKAAPQKPQLLACVAIALGLAAVCALALLLFLKVIPVGSLIACYIMAVMCLLYYGFFYVRTLMRFAHAYPKPNGAFALSLALLSVGVLALVFVLNPLAFQGNRPSHATQGEASKDTWSENDAYLLSDTIVLEKDPSRDFVILNLTDIQLCDYDFNPLLGTAKETFALIEEMVDRTKPDLITLSGDISCGYTYAAEQITRFLDSLQIPWAPVFGNHDHEVHTATPLHTADIFMKGSFCLFKKGDPSLGIGNYIINVKEGERVVQSILLMDTHNKAEYEINGKLKKDYAHFWESQVAWYQWAVEGVQAYGGGQTVKSTVVAHIPLPAYSEAYEEHVDDENTKDYQNGSWEVEGAFGVIMDSQVNSGLSDPHGFFEAMVSSGSTENYICGHDHKNNFSVLYRGVRLTYSLNTGAGCYYSKRLNGATSLAVSGQGSVSITHHYLDKQRKDT